MAAIGRVDTRRSRASGAVLVTMSNLYGYGPVDGPMTRSTPLRPSDHKGALRVRMWQESLAAHEAGRVRVTEARASDYLGHRRTPAITARAVCERDTRRKDRDGVRRPRSAAHMGRDRRVAATLAALGDDERAWGSAWIVPSNPPATVREVLRSLARHADTGEPRLRPLPRWVLRAGGVVIPVLREVTGVLYQFERPFVADGTETTETFGITPTAWGPLLEETADAWRARATHE